MGPELPQPVRPEAALVKVRGRVRSTCSAFTCSSSAIALLVGLSSGSGHASTDRN